ncbi:MAG: undecaprenyldiphospho-muramoylpentapeptide beta-N-acetylglucosaminyltransferase [Muribaculaceae bacterium]|nr:undecaprenyldiphospho-muramoylpentapeptide beta-N-acetylglucosaminyltransferase [Muribaculaceae bacterium]
MRVLISGGGTGGHIFPALSIAAAIRRRDPEAEILFVGAEGRMEMERVPAAGYEIVGLPVSGFDRKRLWRNVRVLWRLWRSMRKARKLVKDFRPDIAIGVGGYASGPTLKAAQKAGVATLLQEQNSYPGVTNKMLAKGAGRICVAYPDLERFFPAEKIVMTGNPVRSRLLECELTPAEAKKALGFDPEKPLLLVVGGSLGARTINQAIIDNALDGAVERGGFQMLWQTGKSDGERCASIAAERKAKDVKATMFISDMDVAYRAADLVVARAGAGTISELELLGLPTVLVPSPNVAEDHQRKNAEALSTRDAAVLVLDKDASQSLWPEVERLMGDEAARERLRTNILALAERGSDERIVDEIYKLTGQKN